MITLWTFLKTCCVYHAWYRRERYWIISFKLLGVQAALCFTSVEPVVHYYIYVQRFFCCSSWDLFWATHLSLIVNAWILRYVQLYIYCFNGHKKRLKALWMQSWTQIRSSFVRSSRWKESFGVDLFKTKRCFCYLVWPGKGIEWGGSFLWLEFYGISFHLQKQPTVSTNVYKCAAKWWVFYQPIYFSCRVQQSFLAKWNNQLLGILIVLNSL